MPADYTALLAQAHEAGMAAVRHHYPDADENTDPGGACGFAWVRVVPGTSSLARWLVKTGRGRKAWNGGVSVWVSHFGQSDALKFTYAAGYAAVLAEAGFDARPESRLD